MSSVLAGPSLNAFIVANASHLGPMVTIPGGEFVMGSEWERQYVGEDEKPWHITTVSTFAMAAYPVTNEEYGQYLESLGTRRFAAISALAGRERLVALGESASEVRAAVGALPMADLGFPPMGDLLTLGGCAAFSRALKGVDAFMRSLKVIKIKDVDERRPKIPKHFLHPRKPVTCVNWFEAFAYASLHGVRLPTEWEWEYAARVIPESEELREYPTPSGELTAKMDRDCLALDPGIPQTTIRVDRPRIPALPNGLHHMTWNVQQWMQNLYGPYSGYSLKDPTGPVRGDSRSVRGSPYDCFKQESLRAAKRSSSPPACADLQLGFRVAARVEAPK